VQLPITNARILHRPPRWLCPAYDNLLHFGTSIHLGDLQNPPSSSPLVDYVQNCSCMLVNAIMFSHSNRATFTYAKNKQLLCTSSISEVHDKIFLKLNNNNNNNNNTEILLSFSSSFKHESHFFFEMFLTAVPLKIQVSGMPSYVDW